MADAGTTGRKAGPLAVMKAVFWSFLGIRKRNDLDADTVRLSPMHVIIGGLIGAAIFITTLVIVVQIVIRT